MTRIYMQTLFNRFKRAELKGDKKMKTNIKKIMVALALAVVIKAGAQAAVSDSLTITITPNAFYAVDIDTDNVNLDMGTVTLGASTQTVRPSTVTIQSTYAQTDLRLQGTISGWTFDSNTASNEQDALATWATFTSIARSSAPAQSGDYFAGTNPGSSGSDVVDTTDRYVGSSVGDGTTNLFENNGDFDAQDMDARAPNHQSHLWLNFRLPNATSNNSAKTVTITLTAVAID